jgi:hypothetical protein
MATMQQLESLHREYKDQLQVAIEAYPDSKINEDAVYDHHVDDLNGILLQVEQLHQRARSEIAINEDTIQTAETDPTPSVSSDNYETVKQTLDDARATYDKDRFILILKLCIVAFIFMKGNDIYVRNAYLFVGLIILFTSLYGARMYLY